MTTSNDQKILHMCKHINISDGKLNDEFLFTIKMVDLFYYKNNIDEIDDWDMEKLNSYMNVFSEKGTKPGELF